MRKSLVFVLLVAVVGIAAAQERDASAEKQIFNAANQERMQRHLPLLDWNEDLAKAAQIHTKKMVDAQQLSHQFPDEPMLAQRIAVTGARVSAVAENVGYAPTASKLHHEWMESPGHRENLLNPRYNALGVAVYRSGDELYATQDYGQQVPAVSADDADLQVRDTIEAERRSKRLPQLRIQVIEGRSDDRCSGPIPRDNSPLAPGHSRGIVSYTTVSPATLPDLVRQRVDDPKYHAYSIAACEDHDPSGFTLMKIYVAFMD